VKKKLKKVPKGKSRHDVLPHPLGKGDAVTKSSDVRSKEEGRLASKSLLPRRGDIKKGGLLPLWKRTTRIAEKKKRKAVRQISRPEIYLNQYSGRKLKKEENLRIILKK